MRKSNDTIGNRTCDLPACSTMPQPPAPACAPNMGFVSVNNKLFTKHGKVQTIVFGRDSLVGTAIRYGLDSPGIESRRWRGFPHPSRQALCPAQPPVQWVPCTFCLG